MCEERRVRGGGSSEGCWRGGGGGVPAVVADTAHGHLMAIMPGVGVTDGRRSGGQGVWEPSHLSASMFS